MHENNNLRLLSDSFRKDPNKIKIGSNNTWEHEMAKCVICIYLKKQKRNFVTEAIFKNNKGRVDVLDVSFGVCYEIVVSEKKESIKIKKDKYPLPVVELDANMILAADVKDLYKFLD